MAMPTFLILGAARSSTTSLHYYLDQHPRVTMSRTKEPNFFAFDHSTDPPTPLFDAPGIVTKSVPDRAGYEALFAHGPDAAARGEASPLYLATRESPKEIAATLDAPRLIAILRNPIERAWSHHLHIRRDTEAEATGAFREACEAEMAGGLGYEPYGGIGHLLRMGRYADQVERYRATFGDDALHITTYEAFTAELDAGLAAMCAHIGVDDSFSFDTGTNYNRSGVAGGRVSQALRRATGWAQPKLKKALPAGAVARLGRAKAARDRPVQAAGVPADLRAELVAWFTDDVERLAATGMVDLSLWADWNPASSPAAAS